jgi:cell division septation protein DedD
MSDVRDSEATGAGRLLGLFFGLVVLCAVFFAFGFTLGRSTGVPEAAAAAPAVQSGLKPSGAPKPEAGVVAGNSGCVTGENCAPASDPTQASNSQNDMPSRDELTFYKAVSQKDPDPKLLPPDPRPAPSRVHAKPVPAAARATSGYSVQVAAVSKREDADALANALRRKQYPVFTTTNLPADKLVHVQVGPFVTLKAAETTRTRLRNDGYNPIVKK